MAASRSQLLLLRHGIAEERREDLPDEARSLTAEGRRRTAAVLERAVAVGIRADRLMASPLTRARQTAEIALGAGLAPAIELATALAPDADPHRLLGSWLRADGAPVPTGEPLRLALVGHEPDLGRLAARLLGAPPDTIRLRKAGLAVLERAVAAPEAGEEGADARRHAAEGGWQLRLLLTPKSLLA